MTRAAAVVLTLALLLLAPRAGAVEGVPDHTGKRVAAVQVIGPESSNIAELTRFLEIRKGDVYSARKVRRTIEVLAKLGSFHRIRVEAVEVAEGVVLTIHVEPIPLIRKITLSGVSGSRQRVLNALGVHVGEPYAGPEELRRMADDVANAYHRAGWREARVQVEPRPAKDGVEIRCVVHEGPRMRISSIRFFGSDWEDVVGADTLARETGLRIGDPATDPSLARARARLVKWFRDQGYLEARVPKLEVTRDGTSDGAIVQFEVSPGERIVVRFDKKAIAWEDQRRNPLWWWEFREARLLALLDLENESTFTEGFAAEGADRIARYYEQRGYFETQVTQSFETNDAKRLKTIGFKIRPGRRVRLSKVTFRGTEDGPAEIKPRALLREFLGQSDALRDDHYVPDDVNAALLHVTNYLRSHGFDGARIEPEEDEIDRAKRRVRLVYDVVPGPRTLVGRVTFKGNRIAAESKLRSVIREYPIGIHPGAPLNSVFLDRSDEALEEHYAEIGFPYADARHRLELDTAEDDEEATVADPAEAGATAASGSASSAMAEQPVASANVVDVHYTVDEAFQAYIGRVIVRGNRYTNRAAIERQLPFKTGDTFTPLTLEQGQEALYRLGPFARVSVVPTEQGEPERVRDVLVAVTEADRMLVEPSIGVSWPDEGPRVGLRAHHRNLFGNGESLSLRAQANWRWVGILGETRGFNRVAPAVDYSQIEERVLLTYAQPTTFGWPLNGSVSASLFEVERNRAFGYSGNRVVGAADQSLDFLLPQLRNTDVRLIGRYQVFLRDIQYETRSQRRAVAVAPEDYTFPIGEMFVWPLRYKIAAASLAALVDGRDDRANPTSGYTLTLIGEVADGMLGSDAEFLRASAAWSLFRPAPARFDFAMSTRVGVAQPLGRSRTVPVDQRFHLGGTGSVRGFRESQIGPKFPGVNTISTGGDVAASYNLELRRPLYGPLKWVVFSDGGWTKLNDFDATYRPQDAADDLPRGRLQQPDRISTSVGIGFRVRTPVGPVKADFAVDTETLDQLDSFRGAQQNVFFHFTIGDF